MPSHKNDRKKNGKASAKAKYQRRKRNGLGIRKDKVVAFIFESAFQTMALVAIAAAMAVGGIYASKDGFISRGVMWSVAFLAIFIILMLTILADRHVFDHGAEPSKPTPTPRKEGVKESASPEQRAWITVTEVHSDVLEGQTFKVRVTFKNSGRTVATDVGIKLVIQMMPNSKVPEFSDADVEIKSMGILSPEGIAYGDQTAPIVLTRDHVESIKVGTTSVYVHGRIVYTDIFKRPHWTTFCFQLRTDGKDPGVVAYSAYGTRYNRTDDNP